MSYELVTIGEAMLRLWVPAGERLEDAPAYRVTVAGAEANVAMATARNGVAVAWLSRLPDSPLGRRAAREIASHGVDVSHVSWATEARMGTYFVELSVPPRPVSVIYDRVASAAATITPDDVAWSVIESARVLHLTGITPALSESARVTTLKAARLARDSGTLLVVDVNYRSRLWGPDEATAVIGDLCRGATVVIITKEDARDLYALGGSSAAMAAEVRRTTDADTVIVTDGSIGAVWDSETGSGSMPGYDAEVVDRIGAGDAFAAGVIIGLLADDLPSGVERGLAMAALKLGVFGDQLVTSQGEIESLIAGDNGREVRR